jgi:hypothetical protein
MASMVSLELPITIPQLDKISTKLTKLQVQLDTLTQLLLALNQKENTMSQALDDLTAVVAENTTVVNSAITLINGLANQILELKDDPVRLATLAHDLQAKTGELAAAVQANTPQLPVTP